MNRARTNKHDSFRCETLGKAGILRKKAVTRVDGLRAARLAGCDDGLHIEIAVPGRPWTDANGFIRIKHRTSKPIRIGIDGNGCNAETAQGANDTTCDFATIGDQDFLEHFHATEGSKTSARTGVGLNPLQGLLICGQLEITTRISIAARTST